MRKNSKKERSDQDLDHFEAQPSKSKELQHLKDSAEKSTGTKRAELNKEIRRRSGGK